MGRTLAAVLSAALLLVPGAGGGGVQEPGRGGTVVFGPVEEPSEAPRRGGKVVVGPIGEPACLNVLLCGVGAEISESVLAGAFRQAPDLTMRPVLVSGATFTTKPPFTLTFRIRPEARWSDGLPITARDFVFTHRMILAHVPAASQGPHAHVASLRPVAAKTIRVVLRSRRADWRLLFPFVLPRHAVAGQDFTEVWTNGIVNPRTGRPIGSGPFLVERWERGRQLTLVRNPRYWGSHLAYLDRIVIRFCQGCRLPPPEDVVEAIRTGSVDLAYAVRDVSIAPVLRAIPGVRVYAGPTTGWENLTLRRGPGGHPALRRKGVRQALVYGLDRVALVRELFGVIDPRYPPSESALVLNTSRSYVRNWRRYTYRPALAQRLLGQEGCRRGADGIYACDGRRLSLQFWTPAGATLRARSLGLIQAQLRRIGVEVVPRFALAPALFGEIMPSGAFDGVHLAYFSAPDGPIGGKSLYGCGGTGNTMGYCQRLVTRDLEQLELILDPSARARLTNQVDVQLANDVPVIPLYQLPFLTAYRQELRNVVVSGNPFWEVENWWLDR